MPDEAPSSTENKAATALPKQISELLEDIKSKIRSFKSYPPHTIQRLAELILSPGAHYRALASYLHAVDRVTQVTSGSDIYPLPPAIPDMSSMNMNGEPETTAKDPAEDVSWGNPTTAAVGSDEALGGALLTPIPWLSRQSSEDGDDGNGAQIHSEGTETIDGPNGMGSIETVSVSVNGVHSTGHARGVTQGELLRQEQRAGVVPVTQLSRSNTTHGEHDEEEEEEPHVEEEEEEVPHARGPDEIGVDDTGLQGSQFASEGGVDTQDIDVAAAVGRPPEENNVASDQKTPGEESDDEKSDTESVGTKREADQELEGEPPKKVRELDGDAMKLDDSEKAAKPNSTANDKEKNNGTEKEAEETEL